MKFKEWLQNRYKQNDYIKNLNELDNEFLTMYNEIYYNDGELYSQYIPYMIQYLFMDALNYKKDNDRFKDYASVLTFLYFKFYDHEIIRDDEEFINEMFKSNMLFYNTKLLYFVNSEVAMINDTISPFTTNTREENGENQALNRTRPIDYNETAENLLDLLNADNVSKNGVKLTTNEVNELKATLLKRIQSDYKSCIDIWLSSMEYIFKQVF